jgi:hypothetical protein
MKTIYAFCGGAAIVGLLAAAMFRNTTPVDQTFTYQGQLRNAGQLVNGAVDLKISMWDADTAGVQIGTSNTFNAVPMTDGRFALGLNFGASAFDGSNRWIQVEFRNPAGSGLYQALNPRDKITATPYALYALNGSNGVWVYDTKQQSVSVLGKKVGIGTCNPTAALEVVSATGGDDSVKLPAGSIGPSELLPGVVAGGVFQQMVAQASSMDTIELTRQFSLPVGGTLVISWDVLVGVYVGGGQGLATTTVRIDGVPLIAESFGNGYRCIRSEIDLGPGPHVVSLTFFNYSAPGFPPGSVSLGASVYLVQHRLSWQ